MQQLLQNRKNNLITISKTKIENNSINPPQTKPQQQQQRQQQSQTQNKTPQSLILSSVSPTLTSSINCINEPIQVNNIKSENIPILNTTPQQLPTSLIDNKHIILRDQSINALNRNLDVNSLLIVNKSYKKEEKRPKSVTASVFKAAPITNSTFNHKPVNKQLQHQQHQQQQHQQFVAKINPKVQAATPTIQQKHQIQDMNKGFLSFAEDATELTMLKEEPDDLQQLATSGDVDACMPLDETTPLLSEMLDGFINSYLSDDINSLDSTTSSTTENTQATTTGTISSITVQNSNNNSNNSNNVSNKGTENIDPFINYREESNDTNCSQHLLSPSVTSKSPEANSLPSLCSPTSLSQEDDFAFMTMSGEDEIDLTTRAPYIPMDEQDNVPLLTDDLMWCSNNAFTADDFNIYKETDPMQQLHMQQQQQQCESNRNILGYQQHELTQQHFSNSLCSSPASTVSSLSPSPVNHHQHQHQQQQQQQQHDAVSVFGTDSSELAALLCGSGNGTLSILSNNCGSTDDNDGTNMSCNIGSSGGGGGGAMNNTRLTISPTQTQPQALTTINGNVSDNFRLHDIQQELLQEQRQQLLGLSIDCKKEKYENTLAPSLSDSIVDAFENIYSKDSTNLDCWNELLQINVNDPTSNASSATCSPVQHQHLENVLNTQDCKPLLHQQQQNIILNTVPLITIQSNKNIFLNNTSSTDKMLINDELLAINRSSSKISTITLLNSAPRRPMTTTATIRVVDNKLQQHAQQLQQQLQRAQAANKTTIIQTITPQLPQQQQQQQQQPQQHGNKRHLTSAIATAQIETKRLRSGNANSANTTIIDLQATPQLLQQLMTPTQHTVTIKEQQKQQQQQQQTQRSKNATQRWSGNVGDSKPTTTAIVQQQQSNSVLKNLLDGSSTKVEPMYIDENSADQEDLSPLGLSPEISKPLHCVTNIASILRNYRHNPMIGGPGVLPSPIFAQNDDSNPPGLTACDTDSASDSGIDDVSFSESGSPLKIQVDKSEEHNTNYENYTTHQMDPKQKDMLLMKCMKTNLIRSPAATPPPYSVNSAPPPLPPPQASQILNERASANIDTNLDSDISSCVQSRKNSISSLLDDANNPLNTPFLMELGNDDYNMTTEPYLETNDIEHVLNEWTHEMA
ncbi:protein similar-like [Teleopsis dalmanni]|uniref:protein similar-like n=1 Tax=Teleopsis dalmanni TaxID=139649 RepID=UPI0018CE73D0|nr:protein similar-like [Teleopsis dalmanni]